jgi:hypothetical protein
LLTISAGLSLQSTQKRLTTFAAIILRIYQPKTTTQKYELEQWFNDCKLEKETKNPEEWITELEHIRVLLFEDHVINVN